MISSWGWKLKVRKSAEDASVWLPARRRNPARCRVLSGFVRRATAGDKTRHPGAALADKTRHQATKPDTSAAEGIPPPMASSTAFDLGSPERTWRFCAIPPSPLFRAYTPHQPRHISRYADSMSLANRGASIIADAFICDRSPPRIDSNRGKSSASRTAIETYSSADCAISSGRPTLLSRLTPTRETCKGPAKVTTGTPIHKASQVVVVL